MLKWEYQKKGVALMYYINNHVDETDEDLLVDYLEEAFISDLRNCDDENIQDAAEKLVVAGVEIDPVELYLRFKAECPDIVDFVLDSLFNWCQRNGCTRFTVEFDFEDEEPEL